MFHRRIWYRALSLRYSCIKSLGIIHTHRLPLCLISFLWYWTLELSELFENIIKVGFWITLDVFWIYDMLAGLFCVIPCTDSIVKVDLRIVSFDVPPQEVLSVLLFAYLMLPSWHSKNYIIWHLKADFSVSLVVCSFTIALSVRHVHCLGYFGN